MRTALRIWLAGMAAALVQPLIQALLNADYFFRIQHAATTRMMLLAVFAVATVFVFALGVPAVLLLRRLGRLGWQSISVAGIVLGALPIAFLEWPSHYEAGAFSASQSWHGLAVDTYVAGIPTTYGWLIYGESIVSAGALGLLSALVFYTVWRRLGDARVSAA